MDWTQFRNGAFLANVLGIVYDPEARKVLIGRRENDKFMKNLSWCFPGGRPSYKDDLETCLKKEIREKTGLTVSVEKIVFAKTYPEKREFLSIYYLCRPIGGKEKAGRSLVELQWVRPSEVQKYFELSTSLHPKLLEFLKTLG